MDKNKKIIIGAGVVIIVALVAWWIFMMGPASTYAPITPAQNTQTINVASNSQLGNYLVGPSGMTLYVKKGESGSSTCYGQCAINWPPLQPVTGLELSAGINGTLGSIVRTDGISQVTYNNKPVYYWINDKVVGDTSGNGFGGVWSIVTP